MLFFDELADWWDKQAQEASRYLEEFVLEHNSRWAIALAGSVQTAMNLGGGFVDVLRLGDGIREGGWRGWGKDGLRLLAVSGPMYRAGRSLLALRTPNPSGGVCAWVSTAQALRQTGTRHLATVEDLARASGQVPGAANLQQMGSLLRQHGAEIRQLGSPVSIENVTKLVDSNMDGVVMFGIKWVHPTKGVVGHAINGFRDFLGRVRFADRTGRLVSKLDELEDLYPGISKATPTGAALGVKNSAVIRIQSRLSIVAVEARAVLLMSREEADAKMAAVRNRHQPRRGGLLQDEHGKSAHVGSRFTEKRPAVYLEIKKSM